MDHAPSQSDISDLVLLTMVPGVGPHICGALLERFRTAGRVLDASLADLRDVPGVGPKLAEKIQQARHELDGPAEIELCRRAGVDLIARGDPRYPPPLHEIPDPPALLYARGAFEPRDQLAIALVGSRRCTPYGMRIAERLAAALARTGFTIVSGLARGIDAAAHRGALKAGGRTIAVLANGLAQIYPPEHAELCRGGRPEWRPALRAADAPGAARGPLSPAQPDHLRPMPGRRRGRGRAAERVALHGAPRDGAEPRGLRRARPGGQPGQPRLPPPDPRRRPPGRDRRRHPRRARPPGPRGPHRPRRAPRPPPRRAGPHRPGTVACSASSTTSPSASTS